MGSINGGTTTAEHGFFLHHDNVLESGQGLAESSS